MIGLIVVVAILAIIAAIADSATSSTAPTITVATTTGGSAATPPSTESFTSAATAAACAADFQGISLALQLYQGSHGALPPAGTAWATSSGEGGPYLPSWPAPKGFMLSWDGTVLSVVPSVGTPSHGSAGAVAPPTGCFS